MCHDQGIGERQIGVSLAQIFAGSEFLIGIFVGAGHEAFQDVRDATSR